MRVMATDHRYLEKALCAKDHLIWVGGISGYVIGIFITPMERALERLRRL